MKIDLCKLVQLHGFETFGSGDNWTGVTTPLIYKSGEPACYFVRQDHGSLEVNDMGNNFMAFSHDFSHEDPACIKSFKSIVDKHAQFLAESKLQIKASAPIDKADQLFGELLQTLASLVEWSPRNNFSLELHQALLKLEAYLRNQEGQLIIGPDIQIEGKKQPYSFDFKLGQTFYDVLPLDGTKTNAALHKILDVRRVMPDTKFHLYFLDPEPAKPKFRREREIFEQVHVEVNRIEDLEVA